MQTEIIAEIGWNFMGDMKLASRMIKAASDVGASTVKFQYWNPEKLKPGPWDHDGRKEIYRKAALDESKIGQLMRMCADHKIRFLCSAFNVADASFLKDLGVEKIKIPSHETHNAELHRFASSNFETVYASLGAGSRSEVLDAVDIYNEAACTWVAMHCVSSYPLPLDRGNLKRIKWFTAMTNRVGYSDHTESTVVPAAAVAMGATVIEKHFTSDKNLPGRDNKFALDAAEFGQMVRNIEEVEASMLDRGVGSQEVEKDTIASYRGRWG